MLLVFNYIMISDRITHLVKIRTLC